MDYLFQNDDRYKTIFNLAPDVIYSLSRKGILTSLSPSFERITGFKTSDWIGRHFAGLIHPDDLAQAIRIFRQTMRGQTVLSYELRILSKKGEYLAGEFSSAPEIVNGKIIGKIGIARDITAHKELERRKDDFIGIASHELKTPVTSLKGYVHLLKREHKPEDKHTEYLTRMDKQLDKLTELIQDLLDLGRIKGGKLAYRVKKFHMADLIRDVVSDLQRITPERAIILKNGIKRSVRGDRDRISHVLINLITNAIKYSPRDRKVLVKAFEDKGNVHIRVRDYGIGIEKSEMYKIFDRFYRVKDSRGKTFPGLGIGLYLSSEIVTRHSGKIWVESGKGQGSTFHFTLPYA